jgi:diaminohydroxyphosphoribosylaminopyrimidine deaminase/5-amino-6-(5-phosphoribosylamino)uracil reductase
MTPSKIRAHGTSSTHSIATSSASQKRADSQSEKCDEKMMRLALREAARGDGRTHPNPSVGAVVFKGDRILGRGFTRPAGGPHAEVVAIKNARRRHGPKALRGASIAVTLEPCSFQGRTGACTEALLEAGLKRVIGGCLDPHPKVSGRGFQRLRRNAVEVRTGVLEAECRRQHRGFISVCERGRPWVTLKLATTLDGRIATASGESRWITGAGSRSIVHDLRDASDAVMIGSGTAIADDPELTVRRDGRLVRTPIRVLIDGRLRVPSSSRLFAAPDAERTWVVCREGARGLRRLRAASIKVIEVPRAVGGHVDLPRALGRLAEEGLTSLFVEGGGGLAAALLRADLVDEVHWMLAPILIGEDGRAGLGRLELARLADAITIDPIQITQRERDLHLHGVIRREPSRRARKGRGRRGQK